MATSPRLTLIIGGAAAPVVPAAHAAYSAPRRPGLREQVGVLAGVLGLSSRTARAARREPLAPAAPVLRLVS